MAARAELERERWAGHETARAPSSPRWGCARPGHRATSAAARDRERIAIERAAAEADLAAQRACSRSPCRSATWSRGGPGGRGSSPSPRRWRSWAPCGPLGGPAATSWPRSAGAEGARGRGGDRPAPARGGGPAAADERRKASAADGRRATLEATLAEARQGSGVGGRGRGRGRGVARGRGPLPTRPRGTRRGRGTGGPRRDHARGRARTAGAGGAPAGRGRGPDLARGAQAGRHARGRGAGRRAAAARRGGEAFLGELARAYVVERGGAAALAGERGHLVVRERLAAVDKVAGGGSAAELRRLDDALATVEGGRRRRRAARPEWRRPALLARAAWAPDLASALELQASLPLGWLAVTRDGAAAADALTVRSGGVTRRWSGAPRRTGWPARPRRWGCRGPGGRGGGDDRDVRCDRHAPGSGGVARAAELKRPCAAGAPRTPRRPPAGSWRPPRARRRGTRRRWNGSRPRRSATAGRGSGRGDDRGCGDAGRGDAGTRGDRGLGVPRRRVRPRRDRLANDVATQDRIRREAEARRARAEAAVALAEGRIAGVEREFAALADREQPRATRLRHGDRRRPRPPPARGGARPATRLEGRCWQTISARLAEADVPQRRASGSGPPTISAPPTSPRWRPASVSTRSGSSPWSSLAWAGRGRAASPLGAAGTPVEPATSSAADDDEAARAEAADAPDAGDEPTRSGRSETAALEAALEALAPRWAEAAPDGESPSPGRLPLLRRRFHELGAANPFAVEEYRASVTGSRRSTPRTRTCATRSPRRGR